MKTKDAMAAIDAGWITKRKGYRVRYQRWSEGALVTVHTPDPADEPVLDSEVSARRFAWKLWQATCGKGEEELLNLVVVDENGDPVRSYVTGSIEVFNPRDSGS